MEDETLDQRKLKRDGDNYLGTTIHHNDFNSEPSNDVGLQNLIHIGHMVCNFVYTLCTVLSLWTELCVTFLCCSGLLCRITSFSRLLQININT